jgi:hypothetical protein
MQTLDECCIDARLAAEFRSISVFELGKVPGTIEPQSRLKDANWQRVRFKTSVIRLLRCGRPTH